MKRCLVSGCSARWLSAEAMASVGWKRRNGRPPIVRSSSTRSRAIPCSSALIASQAAGSIWLTSRRLSSNTPPLKRLSHGSAVRAAGLRWRRENSSEASSERFRP